MDPGINLSRGAARGQPVQPEPRPRWLDDGRSAPGPPGRAPVGVRGPAGLVGPEQQGSLLLRLPGEGGVGFFDPSPHRVGILLVGPELRALRGEAKTSQDPAHRRQGQLDWELVEDPWPDNLQRPGGELELELIGRFVLQSCADPLHLVVGEAGRAPRLGLMAESLEATAGLEANPGADCADVDAEFLGQGTEGFAVAGLDHDQLSNGGPGPMGNTAEVGKSWKLQELIRA